MINIKGIDKARLLKEPHDGVLAAGMGRLQARVVTYEECAKVVQAQTRFDYFLGRPLKSDIGSDEYDERLYDRDAGEGAALRAVERARRKS